jgi:transposase
LEAESGPKYKRASRENAQLVPFQEVIFEMANVHHFRGSRIFRELRSKGYRGGKTALYAYLKKINILQQQKHFTPYETAPGEQGQFDWSPYRVLIGGSVVKIIIFSYINGFSRFQNFEVSLSEDQGSVFAALEESLLASGGVPERIQTDNAKVFVTNASKDHFQWNERYLQFAGHYGFRPTRSLPRHPWSKGKVEKPFQYLENHFIQGASFESFEDLAGKLKAFQQEVNARVHGTTKARPEELIEKDREAFLPLPTDRYYGVKEEVRKVASNCLLSFGGSRYSVPWLFAGKEVWIRIKNGYYLEVYSEANKCIAHHPLAPQKRSVVVEAEHYRGSHKAGAGSFDHLRQQFGERFPGQDLFIEKLQTQKRHSAKAHLYQVLELAKLYHHDDMLCALRICQAYNVYTAPFIAGYLEKNFHQTFALPKEPLARYQQTSAPEVIRSLTDYRITPALSPTTERITPHGTDTNRQLPQDAFPAPHSGDLCQGSRERGQYEIELSGLPAPIAGTAGVLEDRAVGQCQDAAGGLPATQTAGGI